MADDTRDVYDNSDHYENKNVDDANGPRDAKGRFKKGVSGNRLGRPRTPQRSYLPAQFIEDVLAVLQKPRPAVGPDGQITQMPGILLLLERLMTSGIKDLDSKTVATLLSLNKIALKENEDRHAVEAHYLRGLEEAARTATGERRLELNRTIAYFRWKTRKP